MTDAEKFFKEVGAWAESAPETITKAVIRYMRARHAERLELQDPYINAARDASMRVKAFIAGAQWARDNSSLTIEGDEQVLATWRKVYDQQ